MLPPTLRSLDAALLAPLVGRLSTPQRPFSLGFTAASEREGVTTIAANLAAVMAEGQGLNVAIIDANGSMPALSRGFGLHQKPGFSDVVAGRLPLSEALHREPGDGFAILPFGRSGSSPICAPDALRLKDLVADLRRRFDVALFDCPPVEHLRTMTALAGTIEAMIFVLTAARTRRSVARQALADLCAVGGRPWGALINRRPRRIPGWLYRRL